VTDAQIRAAETRANEVVWEARPVRVRLVSLDEAKALGVVPPEGVEGDVRLVEAEGFDRQPCGGTHPRSTAEVGVVVVRGAERYKGGTRVTFVCGHRALATVATQRTILDSLVSILSAPVGELPEVARKAKDDLTESARRERGLRQRALEGEARRLLAEGNAEVIVAAYEGWGPADLRVLAQRLVELAPCVALLGARADKAHIVFAQSGGLPHDIPALLREAVERLGGRGGGRGNMAQGGGDRPEILEQVLEETAARVRSGT
jgi:alanyl-tRNA synthetase